MNRMLINATHELRIALANGQQLTHLIIQSNTREHKLANIYKGTVTRIEPSLEAAFVDYGEGRHGFLPLKEIARSCFKPSYNDNGRRPNIHEVIEEGQELLVQVEKEERGNKGAALTTFITLPGCYLVLMPNNPRAGGVSRRIDNEERDELHDVLGSLQVPEGMGLIIRTAGGGRSQEELQWDLEILLRLWEIIQNAANERHAPFLVYQEGDAVIRALRDHLSRDIDEILIDRPDVFETVNAHLKMVRPDFANRVKLYQDATPLFTRFQIESQIESAFQREVRLPSGGSVIIDHTEALVSIDINSAKSTKGGDIEETALMTNLEAADEIARQLRLRDIGGLIVIDFIDMTPVRNQKEVEDRLRKALAIDRARVQVGRISRFGLLEMSRQRLRPSLGDTNRIPCPRCSGQGTIRGVESLGLSVIRIIEEEALKDNTAQVRAMLPTDVAAYLLNEKRQAITDIEKRQSISVIIIPSQHMMTPQYEVERIRTSDGDKEEKLPSYKLAVKKQESAQQAASAPQVQRTQQEPAIKNLSMQGMPAAPAPGFANKGQPGLIKKFLNFLFEKNDDNTDDSSSQSHVARVNKTHSPMRRPNNQFASGGQNNNRRRPQHNRGRRDRNNRGNNNYRQQNENRDARPQHDHQRDNRPSDQRHAEPRDTVTQDARPVNEHREQRPQQDNRDRQQQQHRPQQHDRAPRNDHQREQQHVSHATPLPVSETTTHHSHTAHTMHETQQPVSHQESAPRPAVPLPAPAPVIVLPNSSAPSAPQQPGVSTGEQPQQQPANPNGPRRHKPRFKPRRRHHRHPSANRGPNTGNNGERVIEGEDIYKSKPEGSSED